MNSILKQYPEVLFRFTVLPIQTESVKPWSITPPLETYLRICFTVTICKCFGSHMSLAESIFSITDVWPRMYEIHQEPNDLLI
jgi:hypothetical protein